MYSLLLSLLDYQVHGSPSELRWPLQLAMVFHCLLIVYSYGWTPIFNYSHSLTRESCNSQRSKFQCYTEHLITFKLLNHSSTITKILQANYTVISHVIGVDKPKQNFSYVLSSLNSSCTVNRDRFVYTHWVLMYFSSDTFDPSWHFSTNHH